MHSTRFVYVIYFQWCLFDFLWVWFSFLFGFFVIGNGLCLRKYCEFVCSFLSSSSFLLFYYFLYRIFGFFLVSMMWFGVVNCIVFGTLKNEKLTELTASNRCIASHLVQTSSQPFTDEVRSGMRKNRPCRCGAKKPSKTGRTTSCTTLGIHLQYLPLVT